jgi:RNA polymerase subunit RPABC4/transcription elongation factor Spt4
MMGEERKDIFLSCFKCGRIVRASDSECPRCGLQFGPGTLFECPFCSGLIWRNAVKCSTCGIDLSEFSQSVEKASSGFDMDQFVDTIISTELEEIKSLVRRVACPGCGLMIRGDEEKCPRCDLPLGEAKVDCPVCGEKISIAAESCPNCEAVFEEAPEGPEEAEAEEEASSGDEKRPAKIKDAARKKHAPKKKPVKKSKQKKSR